MKPLRSKTDKSQTPEDDSQNGRILRFMLLGGSLTPLKALRLFDCWALSSRISDLRKLGRTDIKSEIIAVRGKKKSTKHVSRYSIPKT